MTSPRQRRDSDRYCQLCNAWFNNPGMAQQHYDGKKHKKNAARADLLEQLGKTLDMGEMKGTPPTTDLGFRYKLTVAARVWIRLLCLLLQTAALIWTVNRV